MRTKIVYILVSNPNDLYYEQALMSLYSLRLHNPYTDVFLVVDHVTDRTLKADRTEIFIYTTFKKVVTVPEEYSPKQRSRFLKTSLRRYIDGDFLYIDVDTVVARPLDDIDYVEINIGAVPDMHMPFSRNPLKKRYDRDLIHIMDTYNIYDDKYFNSGVMLVRDTYETHTFYENWHKCWLHGVKKNVNMDQPSLMAANCICHAPIQELKGEWNCQINLNGLNYFAHAYIIHYFASHKMSTFLIGNPSVCAEIKEKGCIPNELKPLLHNPYAGFSSPNKVIGENEFDLFNSRMRKVYLKYPRVWAIFEYQAKLLGYMESIKKKMLRIK